MLALLGLPARTMLRKGSGLLYEAVVSATERLDRKQRKLARDWMTGRGNKKCQRSALWRN